MDADILAIFEEAKNCTRCYGETPLHVPLPDEKNGGIGAKILFLVERPGRVGTGKSGKISFENEDPTAEFFRDLFSSIGIDRRNIFITNVVLCHPIIGGYKDTPASSKELKNCLYFLERQIKTIRQKLIITPCGLCRSSDVRRAIGEKTLNDSGCLNFDFDALRSLPQGSSRRRFYGEEMKNKILRTALKTAYHSQRIVLYHLSNI